MKDLFSNYAHNTGENDIDRFMKGITPLVSDPVSLSIGLPNRKLLDKGKIEEIIQESITNGGDSLFHYCGAQGFSKLIEEVSKLENIKKENVLITNGNTQGADLSFRMLLNTNDVIAFEEYTYTLVYAAADQYESNYVTIPVEEDGINVNFLEKILKENKIKLLYTIPNAHNPCGVTISLEKRKRLLELAYKYNFIIIEDDPYRDLIFEDKLPSIFQLDTKKERVIYLYSFSKTIAPTLRTGYLLANKEFVQKAINLKQNMDCCNSTLNQTIVAKVISDESWKSTLDKQRLFYENQKNITKAFLLRMKEKYGWNSYEPSGGLFYWVDTNDTLSEELLQIAIKHGVEFVPGDAFSLNTDKTTLFRLCYSYCTATELSKGFERLEKSYLEAKELFSQTKKELM